jgi:isochorismate synthase
MVPLSGPLLARLDRIAPDALVAITVPSDATTAAAPSLHWSADEDGTTDAWGAAVSLDGAHLDALASQVRATLADLTALSDHHDAPSPRMFGGQCFDPARSHADDPAWGRAPRALMVLPAWSRTTQRDRTWLQWVGPASAARSLDWTLPVGVIPSAAPAAVRAPDPEAQDRWEALVRAALAAMADGAIAKLVGARRVRWSRPGGWSLAEVLSRLSAHDGARFAMSLAPDVVFVGATPERLVLRRGDTVEVDALAGSVPRGADDPAAIAALLDSAKDRHEHELVVTFIADTLRALGLPVSHSAVPSVRSLPSVHHLWTPIRARSESAPDALTLAAALHPTPAVAGSPRAEALRWIARHEPDPRGWYAGALGWCDARGDGRFVVALRSAVIRGDEAWAYVGAGLVPGSVPSAEWRETEAKLRTARVALEGPP